MLTINNILISDDIISNVEWERDGTNLEWKCKISTALKNVIVSPFPQELPRGMSCVQQTFNEGPKILMK